MGRTRGIAVACPGGSAPDAGGADTRDFRETAAAAAGAGALKAVHRDEQRSEWS